MLNTILLLLASVAWTEIADLTALPRGHRTRTWRAVLIRGGAALVFAGTILAATGAPILAFVATAVAATTLAGGSNLKYRHLGEPLVFSDFAYIGAALRHPRLYIGVLPPLVRLATVLLPPVAIAVAVWSESGSMRRHGAGLTAALLGLLAVALALGRLPAVPRLHRDTARDGLIATLLRYWLCWRRAAFTPPSCPALALRHDAAEIVVIVQCESFVDPVELPTGAGETPLHLPALERARRRADLSGRLMIDGFGAYTMRTEFGVMTGIEGDALGFRRFDPFVRGAEAAHRALPTRFKACGFDTVFVHPFELGFYNRHRLMPALGFDTLIGRPSFVGNTRRGPYVSDQELGSMLRRLVDAARGPALIYAVTMENHGPWAPPRGETALHAYCRHLQSSDAMLGDLMEMLDHSRRPMSLVFFGDHRPSIPGQVEPGPIRHTPYLVLSNRLRSDAGETADLTPAGLHHALIRHAEGDASCGVSVRERAAASSAAVI